MSKEKTDKEYWEKYSLKKDEGFESKNNHDINLDVVFQFKGINDGVIFETKETDINCNVKDLQVCFDNLKKVVRMLDESIVDKNVGEGL